MSLLLSGQSKSSVTKKKTRRGKDGMYPWNPWNNFANESFLDDNSRSTKDRCLELWVQALNQTQFLFSEDGGGRR